MLSRINIIFILVIVGGLFAALDYVIVGLILISAGFALTLW